MAHRQLVASAEYVESRNHVSWSQAFHADVRAAELSLITLPWPQLNALPQYPNSLFYCLSCGLAVLVFSKRNGRVVARSVHANMQHDDPNAAFA